MGNSLNLDLEGKVVVLKADALKPAYQELKFRLFRVEGGFGSKPYTMGRALFGIFLADGEETRMDSYDVERLASSEEIALFNIGNLKKEGEETNEPESEI